VDKCDALYQTDVGSDPNVVQRKRIGTSIAAVDHSTAPGVTQAEKLKKRPSHTKYLLISTLIQCILNWSPFSLGVRYILNGGNVWKH